MNLLIIKDKKLYYNQIRVAKLRKKNKKKTVIEKKGACKQTILLFLQRCIECEMPSFEKIYRETEANIIKAVRRCKDLKTENEALCEENSRLREELEATKSELEKTREKLMLVELKKTALTKNDSKELKRQINEWVREIDESIRILESR